MSPEDTNDHEEKEQCIKMHEIIGQYKLDREFRYTTSLHFRQPSSVTDCNSCKGPASFCSIFCCQAFDCLAVACKLLRPQGMLLSSCALECTGFAHG